MELNDEIREKISSAASVDEVAVSYTHLTLPTSAYV